jgi:hypothetical protein
MVRELPILIMACSTVKAPTSKPLPFIYVYNGPSWQQIRPAHFPFTNIACVSAKHGFLKPGAAILPYDQKMDDARCAELCNDQTTLAAIAMAVQKSGKAFVMGGPLYRSVVQAAERRYSGIAGKVTYASGSYLKQRKQFNEWFEATRVADRQALGLAAA